MAQLANFLHKWEKKKRDHNKSSEASQFIFIPLNDRALTFRTWHYYQSSVNKNCIGEMLRHTNTGWVAVLYITHFGRERQGCIAVRGKKRRIS